MPCSSKKKKLLQEILTNKKLLIYAKRMKFLSTINSPKQS